MFDIVRHSFQTFGLLLLIMTTSSALAREGIFDIRYTHDITINGVSAQALVTGTADLDTGIVTIEGEISNYIDGYRFWPTSWITLIMTSVMPAVSLERGAGINLFNLTDGQLGYEARAITENDYANITTDISVVREGNTIVASLVSEGDAAYPDVVGMGEGLMEITQSPNPEGGFTETGTKQLVTAEGEVIEIPHYAEFVGVDLPEAQERTVRVTVLEASEDMTHVALRYEGVVRPAPQSGAAGGGILWLNRLGLVPGDSTVATSYDATSSGVGSGLGGLIVTSTTPGDTEVSGITR